MVDHPKGALVKQEDQAHAEQNGYKVPPLDAEKAILPGAFCGKPATCQGSRHKKQAGEQKQVEVRGHTP